MLIDVIQGKPVVTPSWPWAVSFDCLLGTASQQVLNRASQHWCTAVKVCL